jgi:hypothetical protein
VFIRWIIETQTAWRDPAVLEQRMERARQTAGGLLTDFTSAAESFLRPSAPLSEYEQVFNTAMAADRELNTLDGDPAKFPELYTKLGQQLLPIIPSDFSQSGESYKSMRSLWEACRKVVQSVQDIGPLNVLDPAREESIERGLFGPGFSNLNVGLVERLRTSAPGRRGRPDLSMIDYYLCECLVLRRFLDSNDRPPEFLSQSS